MTFASPRRSVPVALPALQLDYRAEVIMSWLQLALTPAGLRRQALAQVVGQ
ncbi:MAG TPA: hypothetical protein VH593_30410 [Ktedonobacteraceae bacterium]